MPDVESDKPTQTDRPTHQYLLEAKSELTDLLTRKKVVDKNLGALENSIYAFEGSYLEDTAHGGNIIRGFDGYINGKAEKKNQKSTDSDRLFSMSSTTFTKALQLKDNAELESSQDESKRANKRSGSHSFSVVSPPNGRDSGNNSKNTPTGPNTPALAGQGSSSGPSRKLKHHRSSTSGSTTEHRSNKKSKASVSRDDQRETGPAA